MTPNQTTASERIYGLLSELVDGRCYPLFVPEHASNTTPYIIYQVIDTMPDNSLDGITGHEWANVQIDIYTQDYDETVALAHQVIRRLDSIKPSEYGGAKYLLDDGLYRAIIEYGFWQRLPTPTMT